MYKLQILTNVYVSLIKTLYINKYLNFSFKNTFALVHNLNVSKDIESLQICERFLKFHIFVTIRYLFGSQVYGLYD